MRNPARTLVIKGSPDIPWWWRHIDHEALQCELDYQAVFSKGGMPSGVFSLRLLTLFVRILSVLLRARGKYRYVITFECGWLSFIVAFIQTLLVLRRPRHVILQFIMREKNRSLASRIKYLFMKWCFLSVYICVCSSQAECRYYEGAFGWRDKKFRYVPLHTDPVLLDHEVREEEFLISAGRTFRDYHTLVAAFKNTTLRLLIVASPSNIKRADVPQNVTVRYDVPINELTELMSRSMAVVLAMENRQISVGQSVLLQAMALGKAVIVTNVKGTEDYVEHMKTGLLVPPNDSDSILKAVNLIVSDKDLRTRLGRAAKERVKDMYLPRHYAEGVARHLQEAT